jgi:Protein of unknown function (DUF2865)
MCVRLCDGYYWPMTFDARRSRLDHDSKVCAASCNSEARAFVMPANGEAKDMVDSQGRPYAKLANAFKYRKIPAGSCSCRPDPWDSEARARHDRFAEKAASDSAPQSLAPVSPPASASPSGSQSKAGIDNKPLTIADAEAMILSGGAVDSGSGLPDNARTAQSVLTSAPVGTGPPAATVADAGASLPTGAASPDRSLPPKSKSPDYKRADKSARPKFARQQMASMARSGGLPMPMVAGRISMPAAYPRQQPYVIVQPQGMPYRAY